MVLASAAIAHGIGQSSTTPPRAAIERAQTTDEFLARWKDERNSKLALGAMWTASHSDVGPDRWEAAFQPAYLFMEAIEKGDRASLDPKGIKAFKDRLSGMLKDDDQAIRAFAALLLGVCGDKSYANQVAVLLRPRRATGDFPVYDRGRAAMALGLLGAKEHTLELVSLLKSPNSFDRSGAAFGLGAMRATEHMADVARLLEDADENVRTNAQEGLAMMREPAK
jgi:HEAT repeat protein